MRVYWVSRLTLNEGQRPGDRQPRPLRRAWRNHSGLLRLALAYFRLNTYPGHGNVSINHFIPTAVACSLLVKDYFFVDAVEADEEDDFIHYIEQAQAEDVALCESVQRGLATGGFDQVRLTLRQESALRHFQRLAYGALG